MAEHDLPADEHRERHLLLHSYLDELLADYFRQGGSLRHSVVDLVEWSHAQTIAPVDARTVPTLHERPLLPADEQIRRT